jgi:hypothetical protein
VLVQALSRTIFEEREMNINENMPEIAGFEGFQDHEISGFQDDTPPDAILVNFEVQKEYMPFLSKQEGKRVYKNFVYRTYIKELGFSSGGRRIKDKVRYDEESKQWKVVEIAPRGQSDIMKYTAAWNRFQRGNNDAIDGTPIEMLFPQDPARAEMYKSNHVQTIERLAGLGDADCQRGGMGWRDDRDRARSKLQKIEAASKDIQTNAKLQAFEEIVSDLTRRLAETEQKLSQALTEKMDEAVATAPKAQAPATPAKKRKQHPQAQGLNGEEIEGVE